MNRQERIPPLSSPIEIKKDWQPGTDFWQILTGHQTVYTKETVDNFFNEKDQFVFPLSELSFYSFEENNKGEKVYTKLQNPILAEPEKEGFSPQEVLHQSWLGIQDSLRIYVFDKEGLEKLQQRLISSNVFFELLSDNLGIMIKTKLPAIKKTKKNLSLNLGRIKMGLTFKKESIEKEWADGVVFFLNEKNLQTPTDALVLVDKIARLHPETAKNLIFSWLTQARIVCYNIEIWKKVLNEYKSEGTSISNGWIRLTPNEYKLKKLIPLFFTSIFNQIKSYLDTISPDLTTFEQELTQRLNITPLPNLVLRNSPLPIICEEKARRHLKKILEIALKNQENLERLQKLLKRLEANILKTPAIINEIHESIDPKKWLLTVVVKRGQQLILDRMAPSEAMIKFFKQKFFYKPSPENIRQWIEVMGIRTNMIIARKKLTEAENIYLSDHQQKQYQEAYQFIERKIKKIMKEEETNMQQQKST